MMKKTMKMLGPVLVVLAVAGLSALGALNVYDMNTYTNLLVPTRTTAATTSTAVNVSSFQGIGMVVVEASPEFTQKAWTNTIVVYDSPDGATFTAYTNAAATALSVSQTSTNTGKVVQYKVDMNRLDKYMRVIATPNGGTGHVSVILIAPKP